MRDDRAMEACEGCGFTWDAIGAGEVPERLTAATDLAGRHLRGWADMATLRPVPDRWSMVEYACHLRDVLLVQRDRVVTALVEDSPTFTPMYRDERVQLGLYDTEQPADVAGQLALAATLFLRVFASLDAAQLARPIVYNYPERTERTVLWLGAQTLHEAEHHLADIEENLTLVAD